MKTLKIKILILFYLINFNNSCLIAQCNLDFEYGMTKNRLDSNSLFYKKRQNVIIIRLTIFEFSNTKLYKVKVGIRKLNYYKIDTTFNSLNQVQSIDYIFKVKRKKNNYFKIFCNEICFDKKIIPIDNNYDFIDVNLNYHYVIFRNEIKIIE